MGWLHYEKLAEAVLLFVLRMHQFLLESAAKPLCRSLKKVHVAGQNFYYPLCGLLSPLKPSVAGRFSTHSDVAN